MTAAAFQATVHSLRTVAGRKVVQIVVEAPIEHLPTIARIAEHGSWVAVARLQEGSAEDSTPTIDEPDKPAAAPDGELSSVPGRRNFVLSQKAYLLCERPAFKAFLIEKYRMRSDEDPATWLRRKCCVNSRASIVPGTEAATIFYAVDSEFTAWEQVAV